MFEDLQRMFRESVRAFRSEVSRREPEDQVAELLAAMRRELVTARASLPEYEREVERTGGELAAEREALARTERRGALAQRIGDAETVRIAGEFAARHRARAEVLEKKAAAAVAELELRRREAEEMKARYQEAEANRFVLLAQLRRQAAGQRVGDTLHGDGGAFADFERVREAVERDASLADAARDLEDAAPPPPAADVEARLRELKRRMGKE